MQNLSVYPLLSVRSPECSLTRSHRTTRMATVSLKSVARTARIASSVKWVVGSSSATAHCFTLSSPGSSMPRVRALFTALLYAVLVISLPMPRSTGMYPPACIAAALFHSRRLIRSLSPLHRRSFPRKSCFPKSAQYSTAVQAKPSRLGCLFSTLKSTRANALAMAAMKHDPFSGTVRSSQSISTEMLDWPTEKRHPRPLT